MPISVRHLIRDVFGLLPAADEGLLAGPTEEAVQAVGVPTPILSQVGESLAALCPDLAHEAQWGFSHRA